jgi:hypothetical protein
VDDTEHIQEKEKRKAEVFEKERQERLSKLDEWKVIYSFKIFTQYVNLNCMLSLNTYFTSGSPRTGKSKARRRESKVRAGSN